MGVIKNFFNRIFRKKSSTLALPGDIKLYIERIVSDGILLNELPSPTDLEAVRGSFIRERLHEIGIDNINTDEMGNVYVIFPCSRGSGKFFLVYTDIDNMKYSSSGSIVEIKENKLMGIGIGDNSIGASALLVLCEYLKTNEVLLDFNLLVLFSLRNTPESNFKGIKFFLAAWSRKITAAVYLFGLYLGRMVSHSTGIYNLSFLLKSNNTDALGKNYVDSSVDFAVQLYNEINKIDWSICNAIVNIVRINAGIGFEYFPEEGTIDLEVFSTDSTSLKQAKGKIIELADLVARNKNFTIENKSIAHIPPVVDQLNDPLNNLLKKIHNQLNIETKISSIPDYSSIINQFHIPSIVMGITTGIKSMYLEYVEIRNIGNGFKQVLRLLDELNKNAGQVTPHG